MKPKSIIKNLKVSPAENLHEIRAALLGDEKVRQSIAERAYQLYEQRGRQEGRELDDWAQAENDILTPLLERELTRLNKSPNRAVAAKARQATAKLSKRSSAAAKAKASQAPKSESPRKGRATRKTAKSPVEPKPAIKPQALAEPKVEVGSSPEVKKRSGGRKSSSRSKEKTGEPPISQP